MTIKGTLWLTVGTALVVGAGALVKARSDALERAHRAGLRADSLEAVLDTTKRTLGDSVAMWERRAVQGVVAQDSVARLLNRESRARAELLLRLGVAGTVEGRQSDSAGVHLVSLQSDTNGVHLRAEIVVPHAPGLQPVGRWTMRLDPVKAQFWIECGVAPPDGIRPAIVRVETTGPIQVQEIGRPVVAPEVCAGDRQRALERDWLMQAASWSGTAAAGALAGAAVAPTDDWMRGAALGAAITVGVRLALKAVGVP